MTKLENEIYDAIFTNGRQFLETENDSVNFHAMTHEDTEILGMFCDATSIRGEELKRLLISGYIYRKTNQFKELAKEFDENKMSDKFLDLCIKAGMIFNNT